MTSMEQYESFVSEARSAMDKSVDVWKETMETFTAKADPTVFFPKVDIAAGLDQYSAMTQKMLEAGSTFSTTMSSTMTAFFDAMLKQSESMTALMTEQTEKMAAFATEQGQKVEQVMAKSKAA